MRNAFQSDAQLQRRFETRFGIELSQTIERDSVESHAPIDWVPMFFERYFTVSITLMEFIDLNYFQ